MHGENAVFVLGRPEAPEQARRFRYNRKRHNRADRRGVYRGYDGGRHDHAGAAESPERGDNRRGRKREYRESVVI